jgi:hypothetical protein
MESRQWWICIPRLTGMARVSISIQAVAFYTDTEHKVEPVTKGVRIVLQYDAEVVGWGEKEMERREDDEAEVFDSMESTSKKRKRYEKSSDSLTTDNAAITKVTDIIANLLAGGEEEVAFAMQYLYRKSSILPEFLKGTDAQLYSTLVRSFDVALRPIVLQVRTNYSGVPGSPIATPWDDRAKEESSSKPENVEPDADSDTGSEDDEESWETDIQTTGKGTFHLPELSAIRQISRREYIEHTGNEALPGDKKYFGGGMFVRQKVQ